MTSTTKRRIAREWLIFLACIVIGLFATYFMLYSPEITFRRDGEINAWLILLGIVAKAVFCVLLIGVLIGSYFFPTLIAHGKNKSGTVFVLNLFLGWTLIGWVATLVWACTPDRDGDYYFHPL